MEKGMAIIERDETQTKAVFIDHEILDFARQNAKTRNRLARIDAAKREAVRKHRNAEKAKARRKAYTMNTIGYVLIRFAIIGALMCAGMVELIHPVIWIPVSLFCLCTACLRLGTWFGKRGL